MKITKKQKQYIRKRYRNAKKEAKRRGIAWNLLELDFLRFLLSPCSKCASAPKRRSNVILGRLDRNLGWDANNVQPLCISCRPRCITPVIAPSTPHLKSESV